MRAHSRCDFHIQSCEAELAATRAMEEGSLIQQLQQVGEQEKLKSRMAIKALLHRTHFLAQNHIAHATNFAILIELVVCCGGDILK